MPGRLVAGTVLFKPLPNGVGEVEVGWHLHPDSWGHGYATEAARAVIQRGFEAGLPEVYAVVRPGNEASLAVCRRLGMAAAGPHAPLVRRGAGGVPADGAGRGE